MSKEEMNVLLSMMEVMMDRKLSAMEARIRKDIDELKADVAVLKEDVGALKADVTLLKGKADKFNDITENYLVPCVKELIKQFNESKSGYRVGEACDAWPELPEWYIREKLEER